MDIDKKLFGTLTLRGVLHAVIAVAIFAAISWAFFPNVLRGDVLHQHDVLQGVANGQEGVQHEQQTGEITRWTDALFGGMPTFQIRPTYSNSPYLSWVGKLWSLGMPSPVSWLFIMMLGFFILLLAFDVKWYLAVLGAIGWAFSTYFIILIGAGHIWKLLTLAYVPPTIAGIVLCYRGRYLAGAAIAALFAALQLLSNHVQMTYYFAFVIVALVIGYLVQAISDGRVGRWLIATGSLVVAAALAVAANAPNLYLSYKYSQETIRGGHSELSTSADGSATQATDGGLDKDYITQWSYGKDETFTLMIPNVKGGATLRPEHGDNHFLSLAETDKAQGGEIDAQDQQVLAQLPQYFGDQPMTNGPVYVGILIFALFLLGCAVVRGPVKWSLVVVTILAIFLAWGHNMMWLTGWMIDHFPMYNKFRTPSSILVIAEFTMPLLAVLALQQVLNDPKAFWAEHRMAALVAGGFCAVVCLFLALFPGLFGLYSAQETTQFMGQLQQYPTIDAAIRLVRGSLVSADAWRSLLFLLAGAVVLLACVKGKLTPALTAVAMVVLVLADLFWVNKRYVNADTFVPAMEAEAFTPRPADTQILQDTTHYRVLDIQHFGDAMPSYFHKTVGGYHAAKLTRYNDLIERQITRNNLQVLNMLNTKYVIASDTQVQLNPDALGNAWWVDSIAYVAGADQEMAALDSLDAVHVAVADAQFRQVLGQARAKQPGDTIALTSYAPNKLAFKAHSAQGGLAVFSEIYFPWGWQATIDGKPAELGRVNYVLRAMQLPAGDHVIEMKFDPAEVHQTERTSVVAIIVIFLALLASLNLFVFARLKEKSAEK
ncbi:MAG: hypothetical protein IJT30_00660 [Muribaculaceae bacterium]|nr:hypothetical protein [Muribaculaceae bacterium]